jgi:predicted nucleic acid-binding Zn ribbon protein
MEHIKDIISSLIGELESKNKKTGTATIQQEWNNIVGEKIAEHTKPTKIKQRVLHVIVDQATWAYELNQKYKKDLVMRLNKKIGEDVIDDMFFRIGDID